MTATFVTPGNLYIMSSDAGPSSSQTTAKVAATQEMSPRQKEKSRAIALEDVILDEGRIDHVRLSSCGKYCD